MHHTSFMVSLVEIHLSPVDCGVGKWLGTTHVRNSDLHPENKAKPDEGEVNSEESLVIKPDSGH
jgi:hypothetical protein